MRGNFNNRRRDRANNNNNGTYNNSNGILNVNDRSGNQPGGSGSFYESAETTKAFGDRFEYLMVNSIGTEIIATVNSAVKYSGLLVACNLESTNGVDIILKYPKIVDSGFSDNIDELTEQLGETLLINGPDVAEIEMKNIDFSLDEKFESAKKQEAEDKQRKEKKLEEETANAAGGKSFKTDTDISCGNGDLKERELQKWVPDADDALNITHQTLEESSTTWDQFTVNEEKFGVKPTYDEHFYTTKINKSDPNYEKRLKEAERLAKEIESQGSSGNIHLAEDRGIVVDDSGMDEEDLYSGVDRRGNDLLASLKTNSKPSPAKPAFYVAPSLRNQPHHMDPAIISSTTANNVVNKQNPKQIPCQTKNVKAGSKNVNESKQHQNSSLTANKENAIPKSHPTAHKDHAHKHINSKEAQIEELKKFAQKFKVPYDMPEDMKDILKNSALKGDPSLPPKPTSSGSKSSLPPTPSIGKTEVKKTPATNRINSQSNTPINSPSTGRASISGKRRGAASFFGSKVPSSSSNKKDLFNNKFNMFIQSKEQYDTSVKQKKERDSETKSMEPFFIEKPYFTAPTWPSTTEQSFRNLFPDEVTAIQKAQMNLQQRQMKNMNAAAAAAAANQQMGIVMGNVMRFPMAPGASPNMMNGMAAANMGMYMPFQPQTMFYPSMPHMMSMMGSGEDGGRSPSPQAVSPHIPAAYMNSGPSSASFGYPGTMPFQPMMGSSGGGNGNYRQNYHQNNNHSHNHNQNHHRNNHENR